MAARQQVWIARQWPDTADRLLELVPEPIGDPIAEGMSLAATSTPMPTRAAQPGISNENSAIDSSAKVTGAAQPWCARTKSTAICA